MLKVRDSRTNLLKNIKVRTSVEEASPEYSPAFRVVAVLRVTSCHHVLPE